MESKTNGTAKVLTQKEFKAELEKMTPQQAFSNLKNLVTFTMKKGLIEDVDRLIILEKSLDVLQQAAITSEGLVLPPDPLPVSENMTLSDGEENQMIK